MKKDGVFGVSRRDFLHTSMVAGAGVSLGATEAAAQAAQSQTGTVPDGGGATAKCMDGTFSYAAHHQGACSHHGGVAVWYK